MAHLYRIVEKEGNYICAEFHSGKWFGSWQEIECRKYDENSVDYASKENTIKKIKEYIFYHKKQNGLLRLVSVIEEIE